jgi:hypothetical protein
MAFGNGPRIVTDGLVMSLDAADRNSYVSGSTIWNDLSGNTFYGVLTSGSSYNASMGGSIIFDGINDYVDLELMRNQILNYTSSITFDITFNMSQWVSSGYNGIWVLGRNPDPGGGIQSYILSYIMGGGGGGRFVVQFGNSDGTTGTSIQSTLQIQTNTVYNFVYSFNSGSVKLYQNGNLVQSINNSTTTIYNTNQNKFFIGGDSRYNPGTGGRYFSGSVYTARIYNRELSSQEVLQNYNAQKSRFGL